MKTMLRTAAVGLLVVLAGCGGDTVTSTAPVPTTTSLPTTTLVPTTSPVPSTVPSPPVVIYQDGEVVGGPLTLEVPLGTEARFEFRSDVDDELHVHGYDLTFEVVAGQPVEVGFPADVPGIFEIELHGSQALVVELVVS